MTVAFVIRIRCLNSRRIAEKVSYYVCIEGFLRWHVNWGRMSIFLRMLRTIKNRILAAQSTSKIHNCVHVTIGNMTKYSITLVINSRSDSSHVSTRIAFSNCVSQSSRI
jgi:hypothetical protein